MASPASRLSLTTRKKNISSKSPIKLYGNSNFNFLITVRFVL